MVQGLNAAAAAAVADAETEPVCPLQVTSMTTLHCFRLTVLQLASPSDTGKIPST